MNEEQIDDRKTTLYGFDEAWYLRENPDAVEYRGSALDHYLNKGWKEGRNPSAGFDGNRYISVNSDVREAGICPLLHFLEYGISEGRTGWSSKFSELPNADERQSLEADNDAEVEASGE